MALLALWKRSPDEFRAYALRQIVAMAGDGRVLDGSLCSTELRGFLQDVGAPALERYIQECLEEKFDDSGLALQDVVNEIGRRLEFDVEAGLYRGRKGMTGFDGVWRGGQGLNFLVEVKTTDVYNVKLDQIEAYRTDLVAAGRLSRDSSVLFVVGRQDTGSLEAQIRGSPHAWTMRVIGAASLIRLLDVKLKSESDNVTARIKAVLRPVEYTRVDGIADLMFDTTAELDLSLKAEAGSASEEIDDEAPAAQRAPSSPAAPGLEAARDLIAEALSNSLDVRFVRQRRSRFASPDGETRAIVAVSKRYDRNHQAYWYAFYEAHLAFLTEKTIGYLVLGALDPLAAFVLPTETLATLVPTLKSTVRSQGQKYWHIAIRLSDDGAKLTTNDGDFDLEPFRMPVAGAPASGAH